MSDPKAPAAPPAAAATPRCPLGFSGTPPEGHPSIPGFSDSGPGSGSRPAPSKSTLFLALVPKSADPRKWTTHQVFFVEAVFLVLCVALAIYMPRIKGARSQAQAGAQADSVKTKAE